MKNILTLSVFSFLLFFGCNENLDNTIVSTQANLEKQPITQTGSQFYASELIDGENGGWLVLSEYYTNSRGEVITLYARVRILPGSYVGTQNIKMILNTEDVSIQLFPEMTFARDVKLDLWYKGVDLIDLGYTTSGDVDFVYFGKNGNVELIENTKSKVDLSKNKIYVTNAKIQHFSRYGWIR